MSASTTPVPVTVPPGSIVILFLAILSGVFLYLCQ
jgi:hypothetical protein